MKTICFLLLLFQFEITIAQEPVRKLFDKQTNLPVSFATIKVLNSPKGTIAGEDGNFQLKIEPSDSVLITSVGYYSIILSGKNISTKLYLEPKIKQLSEITIKPQKAL